MSEKKPKKILDQITDENIIGEITSRISKYGMTEDDVIGLEITADAGCLYYKTTLANRYSFSVITMR